eukprot:1188848-Prorocentrum_minimum.AAC.4
MAYPAQEPLPQPCELGVPLEAVGSDALRDALAALPHPHELRWGPPARLDPELLVLFRALDGRGSAFRHRGADACVRKGVSGVTWLEAMGRGEVLGCCWKDALKCPLVSNIPWWGSQMIDCLSSRLRVAQLDGSWED